MVKWLGLLLLAHIAATLVFVMLFSRSIPDMSGDDPTRAHMTILVYDAVFSALFLTYKSKVDTSYIDYRKSIKDDLRANSFSVIKYLEPKEHLIKIAIFMAFQIPFVIFYSIWGMSLQHPIIFEQFYIMDAGSYLVTDSAILGILLNTIMFGTVYSLIKTLFIIITKKNIQKDMIS